MPRVSRHQNGARLRRDLQKGKIVLVGKVDLQRRGNDFLGGSGQETEKVLDRYGIQMQPGCRADTPVFGQNAFVQEKGPGRMAVLLVPMTPKRNPNRNPNLSLS